jgi:predicted enzyme related to lactoylglutathione lyase
VTTGSFGAVGNVFYFVADLDAAVEWYAARLNCEPVVRGGALVAFEVGGSRLTLHATDELNSTGPSGTVPYWTVPDVDAVVTEWTAHGAEAHRGPKTVFTGERLCQLLDPFGNLFGVREEAPRTVDRSPGMDSDPLDGRG